MALLSLTGLTISTPVSARTLTQIASSEVGSDGSHVNSMILSIKRDSPFEGPADDSNQDVNDEPKTDKAEEMEWENGDYGGNDNWGGLDGETGIDDDNFDDQSDDGVDGWAGNNWDGARYEQPEEDADGAEWP